MSRLTRQKAQRVRRDVWRRHGDLDARRKKFGIIVSRFNEFITKRLLDSALESLIQHGAVRKSIETVWVPGALEIPFFAKRLALRKRFDALIVLSCILRGDTIHFESVSNEVIRGVSQVALETGVPIARGIVTADDLGQAIDRAALQLRNEGAQAAAAAVEIANLN